MELQPITSKIYEIRGTRVMLDRDLAQLYQVETRVLNQAVKRNIERFPPEFMFHLSEEEQSNLRSQFVISSSQDKKTWGGARTMPYAFTEQGVAMLSAVLKSSVAIQISIQIMNAFVMIRNYLTSTATLSAEISELRARLAMVEHNEQDTLEAVNDLSEDMRAEIENIYNAIGALSIKLPKAQAPRNPIGYKTGK